MFRALVLVRNIDQSSDHRLDFGEFTIEQIGPRFKELREVFSSADVNRDDWILEKVYTLLPAGPPGSPVGGIPNDIEDILLLLRLYKVGDISFVKQAIILPNGNTLVQFPYRAMNDLNSYALRQFTITAGECESWQAFAVEIKASRSWTSDWFMAARRFFLSGGAKPFNPSWDEVDRILDYATALESTLVPEKDYNTRRISNRAAILISPASPADIEQIGTFLKRVYEIRSRLAHGDRLGDDNRKWLVENGDLVESRVREVLRTAVEQLPPDEGARRVALAALYDPTDDDRGNFALEKFREIKTEQVRKKIAAEIKKITGI